MKTVTVDGDNAAVVYTATIDGTTTPDLTGKVVRVGGGWRFSGTS